LVNKSKEIPQTTVIGKNVMLFSRVGVMSGIKIEENVVVGYGSVVTKNCEKDFIYAGNPAKKIGERV
jgi:maltose O-acetyltransferase